jgi:hypothetical protein
MRTPASFGRIVARFGHLKQLTAQAQRLATLDRLAKEVLPPGLRQHARLAAIRDGCLVFHADSAAWATKLRYRTPEILARLPQQPEFDGVRSIRVRPQAEIQAQQPAPDRMQALSPAAATAIKSQAESIGDERLRDALYRIAKHAAAV